MEIPSAGIVNRYIATQGPLPHTCAHFWQVVWDHKLSLIIMLTTLTERGRVSAQVLWMLKKCTIPLNFFPLLWLNNLERGQIILLNHSSEGGLSELLRADSRQLAFCYAALQTNQLSDKQKSLHLLCCADQTGTMCCRFSPRVLASMWQFPSRKFSKCLEHWGSWANLIV